MADIINGVIYAVDFKGTNNFEFSGIHPAMVIRTLKEENMYFVVPLTTYTKEKWEKCKRKGFGTRIKSTNSIARVDKILVLPRNDIKNRWYYNDELLSNPTLEEVEKVLNRVEEYYKLSRMKCIKEYKKYLGKNCSICNNNEELNC